MTSDAISNGPKNGSIKTPAERKTELWLTIGVCLLVLVISAVLLVLKVFETQHASSVWQGIVWAVMVCVTGYTGGRSFVKSKRPIGQMPAPPSAGLGP